MIRENDEQPELTRKALASVGHLARTMEMSRRGLRAAAPRRLPRGVAVPERRPLRAEDARAAAARTLRRQRLAPAETSHFRSIFRARRAPRGTRIGDARFFFPLETAAPRARGLRARRAVVGPRRHDHLSGRHDRDPGGEQPAQGLGRRSARRAAHAGGHGHPGVARQRAPRPGARRHHRVGPAGGRRLDASPPPTARSTGSPAATATRPRCCCSACPTPRAAASPAPRSSAAGA